jgi:pyruvate formate lyase activating enzyme
LCPSGARELCGKPYSVETLFRELIKDKIFYESSGGGVTFSGGECMLQIDFLAAILKKCKENGIHTAVDTAGHVPFSSFERILSDTDLFLYDVKCFDSETHRRYTGVGNELIKENLGRLLRLEKPVWVRIPIISGVNDTVEEMRKIKDFLDSCGSCARVELLPYHAMGEHKYEAIGSTCRSFTAPTDAHVAVLQAVFKE